MSEEEQLTIALAIEMAAWLELLISPGIGPARAVAIAESIVRQCPWRN